MEYEINIDTSQSIDNQIEQLEAMLREMNANGVNEDNTVVKKKVDVLNHLSTLYRKHAVIKDLDICRISLELSEDYIDQALDLSRRINYKMGEGSALLNLGQSSFLSNNYELALNYLQKAYSIFSEEQLKYAMGEALNNIGIIYWNTGKHNKALEYYLKSLKVKEEINDKDGIARLLNNIGLVYTNLSNERKALTYYLNALRLKEELGDEASISTTCNNIGIIYRNMQEFDKALEYYLRSLEIKIKLGNDRGAAFSHNNIGLLYWRKGDMLEALKHYESARDTFQRIGDRWGVANTLNNIGNLNIHLKNYDTAAENLKKALPIAIDMEKPDLEKSIYRSLTDLYERKADLQKDPQARSEALEESLAYFKQFNVINEKIFNERTSSKIAEVQAAYEMDKKVREAEIYRLKNIQLTEMYKRISAQNAEISEQKEKLEVLNHELHEANATKDKFYSIIAHDLKNPLSILRLSGEMLEENFNNFERDKILQLIKKMNLGAKRLADLLDDLLSWARFQMEKIEFQPEVIDLYEIANDACYLLKPSADKKRINLIFEIDGPSQVFADRNMIKTTVRNLISNAIKFTGFDGEVRLVTQEKENLITFSVYDNGVGIPPENRDRLFRIDSTISTLGTAQEKGTGLGLILCKEFISKNGGSIRVESEEGKGSRFFFTLPRFDCMKNENPSGNNGS